MKGFLKNLKKAMSRYKKRVSLSEQAKPSIPKRFLGAFKAGHRVVVREFIDEELSYKLLIRIVNSNYQDTEAVEALDYITRFNNEFHKAVVKKDDPTAIHNTDELRNDCFKRNNSANRDLTALENKSMISLDFVSHMSDERGDYEDRNNHKTHFINHPKQNTHEDTVISLIEKSKEEPK